MIRPYRFAVALAYMSDAFADLVPPEHAYMAQAARDFAKALRRYAGPEDPVIPHG